MKHRNIETQGAQMVAEESLGHARISVIGLGRSGVVSTACLSAMGHQVVGADIDRDRLDQIAAGVSPKYEKGLADRLRDGLARNAISVTDDLSAAVRETDISFVLVDIPTGPDGCSDFTEIKQAARSMAVGLCQKVGFHIFAVRCAAPPGTTMQVLTPILEKMAGKRAGRDFGLCYMPEFLREGKAVRDFFAPITTVIGTSDHRTATTMRRIFAALDPAPLMTTVDCAEMVGFVENTWRATQVCFANEVGRLCKSLGDDGGQVMEVFCKIPRRGPGFANVGQGQPGHWLCQSKDVRPVRHVAEQLGVSLPLMGNLDRSNREQLAEAVRMVRATGATCVGVLGLACKAGTDELRDSPILEVMATLRDCGVKVVAHDAAIRSDRRLHRSLTFARTGNCGLGLLARELPELMRDTVEQVVSEAQAVIVFHNHAHYWQAVQNAEDVTVIDVMTAAKADRQTARAAGLGVEEARLC